MVFSTLRRHGLRGCIAGVGVLFSLSINAETSQLCGAGSEATMSRSAYHLHMGALWLCIAIGIVTFIALFYSFIKYRRCRRDAKGHLGVEMLWAAIPTLILILLAIPITKVMYVIQRDKQPPVQATSQVSTKVLAKAELMKLGKKAYGQRCAVCHQVNGEGLKSVFPALKGSPLATGPAKATIDIVLNGKPGTAMPAFRQQMGSDTLASVITYVRNAWGNDVNTQQNKQTLLVQPSDVVHLEKQG